jgi:transcriptional regulator with XRE-family HTH domain
MGSRKTNPALVAFRKRDKRRDNYNFAWRGQKHNSAARAKLAIRLRDRGLTLKAIAAKLGVNDVTSVARLLAHVTGRKSWAPRGSYFRQDVAKSPLLRDVTLTGREIASALDTSASTVSRWRARLGIIGLGQKLVVVPEAQLGRMPDRELAAQLSCSEKIVATRRRALGIAPLQAPHAALIKFQARDRRLAHLLPARLRRLAKLRDAGLTLAKIGKSEGLTRERVRQLLSKVLS